MYVEPIYLEAEASQLPELRRVIVAYGTRIAMEESLAEALAQVMEAEPVAEQPEQPGATETSPAELEGDVAELIRQADLYYRLAEDCLKTGDWACYGREMDGLKQVLEALMAAMQE